MEVTSYGRSVQAELDSLSAERLSEAQQSKQIRFQGLPAPGSALSITDPCSSQSLLKSGEIPRVSGGVDWLEVSLWVGWNVAKWEALIPELERLRDEAQANREAKADVVSVLELDSGDCLAVEPRGMGTGIRCKFALTYRGMKIGLVDRRQFKESAPNVRVSIPSDALMVLGHGRAWEIITEVIAELGGQVVRTNVSRLDVCADVVGVKTTDLIGEFSAGHSVSRLSEYQLNGRRGQSDTQHALTVGKENRVKIYNKLLEAAPKPDKLDIMIQRRWGGEIPDTATRVEFQLRGAKLKERFTGTDNSVETVFSKLPLICEYATEEWFRLNASPVDRKNKHQSRGQVSQLWQQVMEAFQAWAGPSDESWLPPILRSEENTERMESQTIGCLAQVLSKLLPEVNEVTAMAQVQKLITRNLADLVKRTQVKQSRLALSSGVGVPVDEASIPF